MRVSQTDMLQKIQKRVLRLADEIYNPATTWDSDGTDQYMRDGLMRGLEIVEEEFAKHKVVENADTR